jgi:itaconate CoA-transferase
MSAPLAGITVVALEQAVAAPLCSSRLADAGARVIKLERPEGDFARRYDTAAAGGSSYFVWLNRGKESVVVDLQRPEDRGLVERLIAAADVFIENLAPGAAARLGLDPATLRQRQPRLITCSITGYGPGSQEGRKAYDLLVQAESGLASVTGTPDAPGRVGVSVVDIATGLNAYAGILQALYARQHSGAGQHVAVSLFGAIAEWMAVPLLHFESTGRPPPRVGLKHPSIAPYGVFATASGDAILLSIQNEREWQSFCSNVLDDAALATETRFATNAARVENRAELDALVSARFATHGADILLQRLDAASIAYGRLNDVAGLASHPHLQRFTVETENGPVSLPAPPSGIPDGARAVPRVGEHNEAIEREFGRREFGRR